MYSRFIPINQILIVTVLAIIPAPSFAQSALEEVIVTARKRDESFLYVPVTMNVFTEAEIESAGIETPADYIALTPNVTMVQTQNQGTSFITVRGISQARNSEPSVAVLIDGVLMANPSQFNQELFDIEQIEVLKGPQGALYGRNAIGGAITVRTKQPSDEFEGKIVVGGDSGPGYKVQAGASGPLPGMGDLKYRASFSYKDTDGYIDNTFLGEEADPYRDISGRLKLLWQPTDNLTADLRFSISEVDTQALYFNIAEDANDTSLDVRVNNPGENTRDMYSVSLKLDYETEYGTFTSISAYDDLEELLTGDQFDFLPIPESVLLNFGADQTQHQFLEVEAFSQEIRFTSPSEDRFRWIVGGYLISTDRFISTGNLFDFGTGALAVFETPLPMFNPQWTFLADRQDNFAWAVFGSMSYNISDDLEATFSLRYDKDTRENTSETPNSFLTFHGLPPVNGIPVEESWDDLQPKFTLSFRPLDNLTLYTDISRGFRSGGFNQSGVGTAVPTPGINDLFDQETADTMEFGAKAQFFDDRLLTKLSVYKTNADGSYFFFFDPGTSTQNLGNLFSVEYEGLEFEATALVTEGLSLNVGLGLTDSEIEKAADPSQVGNEAPLVSEYTLNLGGIYEQPIQAFGGLYGFIRADYQIIGDTYWDPDNLSVRDPVDLLDLRFGVAAQDDNWSLTFWSKNLLDEEYNAEFSPGPAALSFLLGDDVNFLFKAPPRRWGVDFVKRF